MSCPAGILNRQGPNIREVHLRFKEINKVVRWPRTTQEQLDRFLRVKGASGLAKRFYGSPWHKKIKGKETASGQIRGFHLAANEETRQGTAKLVHQQALVQNRPVQP